MAAAIKLEQVNKSYLLDGLEVPAVAGISLTVNQGEFVALMGPSGSGKSTLMSLIGCLDQATSGEIYLGKQKMQQFSESDLAQIRGRKIGFMQKISLGVKPRPLGRNFCMLKMRS